jgi:salicylate hydroxylase
MKILIAGGGIGGLATAVALSRLNLQFELFERSTEFAEVGAGIQLGPNVMKILHGWGLQQALAAVVALPERLQVLSAISGDELGVLRLGSITMARYGTPYATIHRADLQALLLEVLSGSGERLHTQSEVTGYVTHDQGVSARIRQSGKEIQACADVLVGADGLRSRVRQQMLHDGAPRATGHLAYRAMVLQSNLPRHLRSQQVSVWLGPRMHVVHYPVRGGEWLNVVAIVQGHPIDNLDGWDHSANATELWRNLEDSCTDSLLDLMHAIDDWHLWSLSIRAPMRGWHEQAQGRVALLGDAAHSMLPYLAQGAGMAIEDAAELSQAMATNDIPTSLRQFANQRWQRNARVQARAIRNGQIFHATGLLRWARDAAMKLMGESLLDLPWLYRGADR